MDHDVTAAEVADATRTAVACLRAVAETRLTDADMLIEALSEREARLTCRAFLGLYPVIPVELLDLFLAGVSERETSGEYDRLLRSLRDQP
jgi:hypothetical protein